MRRDSDVGYYMDLDLYAKGERIFDDIYNERYIGKKYAICKRYGGLPPVYTLGLKGILNVYEEKTEIGIMNYFHTSVCYNDIWLFDVITFTCPSYVVAPLNYLVYDPKFKLKLQLSGLLPELVDRLMNYFEIGDKY